MPKFKIEMKSTDYWTLEIEADGLLAVCLQHEIDHLNGVLYPMRVRDFRRFGYTEVLFPELN